MKKLLAIGLLVLFSYHLLRNHVAEWVVLHAHNYVLPQHMQGQQVVIKMPVSLPYTAHWQSDGNHQLIRDKNDFYNIVEQRYENDTLYTVLQRNQAARDQFFALADLVQQETETPAPVSSIFKLLKNLSDYYTPTQFSSFLLVNGCETAPTVPAFHTVFYLSPFSRIPTPPPQVA